MRYGSDSPAVSVTADLTLALDAAVTYLREDGFSWCGYCRGMRLWLPQYWCGSDRLSRHVGRAYHNAVVEWCGIYYITCSGLYKHVEIITCKLTQYFVQFYAFNIYSPNFIGNHPWVMICHDLLSLSCFLCPKNQSSLHTLHHPLQQTIVYIYLELVSIGTNLSPICPDD